MKHVEVLATYDHPKHKVHEGAAIWAYKKDKSKRVATVTIPIGI